MHKVYPEIIVKRWLLSIVNGYGRRQLYAALCRRWRVAQERRMRGQGWRR